MKHVSKGLEYGIRTECRFNAQIAFEPHLVSYEGSGLCRALQVAGDDDIDLNIRSCERVPYVSALCNTLFVQRTLLVLLPILPLLTCTCMTQKINDHRY